MRIQSRFFYVDFAFQLVSLNNFRAFVKQILSQLCEALDNIHREYNISLSCAFSAENVVIMNDQILFCDLAASTETSESSTQRGMLSTWMNYSLKKQF